MIRANHTREVSGWYAVPETLVCATASSAPPTDARNAERQKAKTRVTFTSVLRLT